MISTLELLRKSWFGPMLIGFLVIVLVVSSAPYGVSAGDDDDDHLSGGALAVLLLAIGGAVAGVLYAAHGHGAQVVFDQLQTAVDAAILAESEGDRPRELSRVSKAIGATHALIGLTPACGDACDDVRSDLQNVIGILAHVKSNLIGHSKSCQPNGVIQPKEQCDPLAVPTGCPTSSTLFLFCNDECQCQGIVP